MCKDGISINNTNKSLLLLQAQLDHSNYWQLQIWNVKLGTSATPCGELACISITHGLAIGNILSATERAVRPVENFISRNLH